MLEAEGLLRIGLRERSRIEARANVRIGPGRMAGARPRSCDKVGELRGRQAERSEEHTSELQSLMRISYAVFCLKKKTRQKMKVQLQKHKDRIIERVHTEKITKERQK